jgi:hypothetical protein
MLQAADESQDGVSREEACTAMRCTLKQASYHIQLMISRGLIVRVRGGVKSRYCRPAAAAAVHEVLEERDHAELVRVRQVRVAAVDARVNVVPKKPIRSIFDLAEAMA